MEEYYFMKTELREYSKIHRVVLTLSAFILCIKLVMGKPALSGIKVFTAIVDLHALNLELF